MIRHQCRMLSSAPRVHQNNHSLAPNLTKLFIFSYPEENKLIGVQRTIRTTVSRVQCVKWVCVLLCVCCVLLVFVVVCCWCVSLCVVGFVVVCWCCCCVLCVLCVVRVVCGVVVCCWCVVVVVCCWCVVLVCGVGVCCWCWCYVGVGVHQGLS